MPGVKRLDNFYFTPEEFDVLVTLGQWAFDEFKREVENYQRRFGGVDTPEIRRIILENVRKDQKNSV